MNNKNQLIYFCHFYYLKLHNFAKLKRVYLLIQIILSILAFLILKRCFLNQNTSFLISHKFNKHLKMYNIYFKYRNINVMYIIEI